MAGVCRSILLFSSLHLVVYLRSTSLALTPYAMQALSHQNPKSTRGLSSTNLGNSTETGVSSKCSMALVNLTTSKELGNYVDAAGKPPSGFTQGNLLWIGSYEVCQEIPDAHYCMVSISAHMGNNILPIRWGLCVPKACSERDTSVGLEDIFDVLHLNKSLEVSVKSRSSYCAKPSEYSVSAIVLLFFCAVLCALSLIGTIVDGIQSFNFLPVLAVNKNPSFMAVANGAARNRVQLTVNKDEEKTDDSSQLLEGQQPLPVVLVPCNEKSIVNRLLLCFSLTKNAGRIMDMDVPADAITSLNGMRFISMTWVILGHTYLWMLSTGVVNNYKTALEIVHRFSFQAINNAFLSVDSFFFLSGLLMAYLGLRQMNRRNGHLPLLQFYLHRFLRLTPTYMFVIWFYVSLEPHLGSGPLWYTHQMGNPACEKYWWTNVLYINNFYPNELIKECLGWSWYLANDMQFFAISPVLLYMIYRYGNKGLFAGVGGLLAASFVVTGVLIGYYKLPVALAGEIEGGGNGFGNSQDYTNMIYVKPYCRIAPYLVGLALGYLFHKDKQRTSLLHFRPSARVVFILLGWIVAIVCGLASLYGLYKNFRTHPEPFNMTENVIYGVFGRFAWAVALAWVIYTCHTGVGGTINSILSARIWIPLSRLTYSAYLLHPIVLGVFYSSFQSTITYTDSLLVFYFVAIVAVSYACAFVLALMVEFPTMQLEKLILK